MLLADIQLQAEFEASENLGKQETKLEFQFDAVTCMFAIHYFFASKQALDNFFHNVSINLKEGQCPHYSDESLATILLGGLKSQVEHRRKRQARRDAIVGSQWYSTQKILLSK